MKMAKLQKSTLDPAKVSGRCGRLRCCLRYEHEGYEALDAKLPPLGAKVDTAYGTTLVIDRQILTQLLLVRTTDDREVVIPREEIRAVLPADTPFPAAARTEPGPAAERGEGRGGSPPPGLAPRAADPREIRRPEARELDERQSPPPGRPSDGRTCDAELGSADRDRPGPADSQGSAPPGAAAAAAPGTPHGSRRRRRRRRRRGAGGMPGAPPQPPQ
jgi:hypothetical protein